MKTNINSAKAEVHSDLMERLVVEYIKYLLMYSGASDVCDVPEKAVTLAVATIREMDRHINGGDLNDT